MGDIRITGSDLYDAIRLGIVAHLKSRHLVDANFDTARMRIEVDVTEGIDANGDTVRVPFARVTFDDSAS